MSTSVFGTSMDGGSVRGLKRVVLILSLACLGISVSNPSLAAKSQSSKTSTTAKTSSFESSKTDVKWRAHIHNYSFKEELGLAEAVGVGLTGDVSHRFHERIGFHLNASVNLANGHSQDFYSPRELTNGLRLKEALIDLQAYESLHFAAGAIDQNFLEAPLLLSGKTFPGAQIKYSWKPTLLELNLIVQQAIPTAETLSSLNDGPEKLPRFTTESIKAKISPVKRLKLKGHLTHYKYRDLPTGVAQNSYFDGNSVHRGGDTIFNFLYQYEGLEVGSSIFLELNSKWNVLVSGNYLENQKAPTELNKGQIVIGQSTVTLPNRWEVTPSLQYFVNQADASVAAYNSNSYGHSNRYGMAYGIELELKDMGLKLGGVYVDSHPINRNDLQSRQETYLFKMETNNVGF